MDKIEKEFFEAFGTELKEPCKYSYSCGHAKPCCPRKKCLPPITADTVLRLEEIILDKYVDSLILTKIKDRTFEYRIGYSNQWSNIVQDDTRKNTLLKLCIELKDEIYNEVRNLFNGQ